MSAIDVRALVLLLRRKLVGLRMANVYDVSGRLYLLKLSKANRKEHLLIEAGIRLHTTEFLRNKKDVPSGFTMKLRKHMRTKKLEKVEQLGIMLDKDSQLTPCVSEAVDELRTEGVLAELETRWLTEGVRPPVLE